LHLIGEWVHFVTAAWFVSGTTWVLQVEKSLMKNEVDGHVNIMFIPSYERVTAS